LAVGAILAADGVVATVASSALRTNIIEGATPEPVYRADEPTPTNFTPWALAVEVIPTIAVNMATARIAFVPLI